MLLLALVRMPWRLWIILLLIAFPATALGVLCATTAIGLRQQAETLIQDRSQA
jgi:hypothetical protein